MSLSCEQPMLLEPITCAPVNPCANPCDDINEYGSKALMVYIGIFLIIFFLAIIIAAVNASQAYYGYTLPSWAPTLTTWTVFFAIVLFFTALAASKMQLQSIHKGHWYSIFFSVSIFLILFFLFCIFQLNNYRTGFWLLLVSAILLVITMFMGWNSYRFSSMWLIPLLVFDIILLIEVWQIISANNL